MNRCDSRKHTTWLDLSTPPLSLDNGLKQWSLRILFLKFCLTRGIDIISDQKFKHFFPPQTCAQPACFFPPEQANHSCLCKDSTFAELKLKFGVHVEFLLFGACFSFSLCFCISAAKLGLASRWRSTARFRATSLFHKELAKSDQSINKFIYFVGENTGTPLFFSDSPVSREYQLVRSWRNCLAKYMGFFMP